jgi:CheY-like chemotaxis protein
MTRILLAGSSERIAFLASALAEYQIYQAHDMKQAQTLLGRLEFDAVLCSTHFDDAKMFELLKYVRDQPTSHTARFICLAESTQIPSRVMQDCVAIATRYLGASACLVLEGYGTDEVSRQALTRDVQQLISAI